MHNIAFNILNGDDRCLYVILSIENGFIAIFLETISENSI